MENKNIVHLSIPLKLTIYNIIEKQAQKEKVSVQDIILRILTDFVSKLPETY